MPLTLFRPAPAIGLAAMLFLAPAQAIAADIDANASYVIILGRHQYRHCLDRPDR